MNSPAANRTDGGFFSISFPLVFLVLLAALLIPMTTIRCQRGAGEEYFINDHINEGEGYGFIIGESMTETFERIRAFAGDRGEFKQIEPSYSPEELVRLFGRNPKEEQPLELTDSALCEFTVFVLHHIVKDDSIYADAPHVNLTFNGDGRLEKSVRYPPRNARLNTRSGGEKLSGWPEAAARRLEIGMDCEEAAATLAAVGASERYRQTTIKAFHEKPLARLDAAGYERISRSDSWVIRLFPDSFSTNYIQLRFDDGRLAEISRLQLAGD
ncbi:hypothetical protein JW905_07600 [bacterium]|nr:hypothetical protein [candidate division CSSED10-310 bacterium]